MRRDFLTFAPCGLPLSACVPRAMVSADGRGETNPVASNATAEGRARNRRIEVMLVGPGN